MIAVLLKHGVSECRLVARIAIHRLTFHNSRYE